MTMRAYSEDYLPGAQRILGDLLDFAVNSCDFTPCDAWDLFAHSAVAGQFERGNPTYIAGRTGCELFREILESAGLDDPDVPDAMYVDRSPEYWAGWALAFYQWYTAKSFVRITYAVGIEEILQMYPVFHEMDILQFAAEMDVRLGGFYKETQLKYRRRHAGLSQNELARLADVPLRQIQMFEQRQRDINHAGALCVAKLARALGCRSEDILEI